jgi:hypothetical protein
MSWHKPCVFCTFNGYWTELGSRFLFTHHLLILSWVPKLKAKIDNLITTAPVKQQPPVQHKGWIVSGQETLLHWAPVP